MGPRRCARSLRNHGTVLGSIVQAGAALIKSIDHHGFPPSRRDSCERYAEETRNNTVGGYVPLDRQIADLQRRWSLRRHYFLILLASPCFVVGFDSKRETGTVSRGIENGDGGDRGGVGLA